jgi:RNA polymerase primary sigma factor
LKTERAAAFEQPNAGSDILSLYLSKACRHRILSREEEAALSARIQRGDEEAWEELVRCNLRLVISIARRYVGQGVELGDLIQEGNLGLMRAARSFDVGFGTKFSTYATRWIKKCIGRTISNKASLIRIPDYAIDREKLVTGIRARFQATTGREPSISELSELTGKSEQEVTNVLTMRKAVISYDVLVGEGDSSLSDLLTGEMEADTEALFMKDAHKDSIHDLLTKISKRQRYVVERRYGLDGSKCATLKEIGQEIGVTREWARQLQNTALRKLHSLAIEAELESEIFSEAHVQDPA